MASQATPPLPPTPELDKVTEYLGIDEKTMEVERLTLLNHIQLTT